MSAYVRWTVERALPLWATAGYDLSLERFHERLAPSRAPLDVPHRAMVQARQIYVYAQAASLGWYGDGGVLAERAMASLLRRYLDESPTRASIAFSTDARGAVVSAVRDAYAHAFMLFALASLHRLNGERRLLEIADKIAAYIDEALADPVHGGVFDAVPVTAREKRQNPLMHLLEAFLALEEVAPGRGHLERARALLDLFKQRLFQPVERVLLEHFAEDWSAHPDPEMADIFEPGHHFEWVWLLGDYERLSGEPVGDWADALYDVARRTGFASDGLIFDEVGKDMRPRKRSHRVWPHTEAIKAAVMRARRGDPAAITLADACAERLLATFLDRPFAGGWIDHVGEAGAPLVDYVPASSLYHLVFAASELATLTAAEERSTREALRTPA